MRHTVIFILAACLVVGCSLSSGSANTTTRLRAADNGKTIELKAGDRLEIELEGNPTTGYTWEQSAADAKVLRADGDPVYTQATSQPGMVGVGGVFVFKYTAAAAGSTPVKLIYHRVFEPGVAPIQTFDATIVVK